jgi:mycoredoxin
MVSSRSDAAPSTTGMCSAPHFGGGWNSRLRRLCYILTPPFPDERILRSMLTVYTTTWCGHCVRLKRGLKAAGIGFHEVNIEEDDLGAEVVMGVNGGNMTVPTIVFPDGTALTNPPIDQVRARLAIAS